MGRALDAPTDTAIGQVEYVLYLVAFSFVHRCNAQAYEF